MGKKAMYKYIKFSQQGPIGQIILNRPEVLNAWTPVMLQEFKDALNKTKQDLDCKAVIIKGEGRAFCSGFDLNEIKKESHEWQLNNASTILFDEATNQFQGPLREIYRLLWESPVIYIAQMHGYVVESALAVAMHCDISIAADDAKLFWRSIGGSGMLWHLWPWTIGMRKTKELILRSRSITGKEAAEIGMINSSVPIEELEKVVNSWVEDIIKRPREFLYLDKIAINKAFEFMGINDALDNSALAHILSHLSEPGRAFTRQIEKNSTKDTKKALTKRLSP